jgi:hypothetical protein
MVEDWVPGWSVAEREALEVLRKRVSGCGADTVGFERVSDIPERFRVSVLGQLPDRKVLASAEFGGLPLDGRFLLTAVGRAASRSRKLPRSVLQALLMSGVLSRKALLERMGEAVLDGRGTVCGLLALMDPEAAPEERRALARGLMERHLADLGRVMPLSGKTAGNTLLHLALSEGELDDAAAFSGQDEALGFLQERIDAYAGDRAALRAAWNGIAKAGFRRAGLFSRPKDVPLADGRDAAFVESVLARPSWDPVRYDLLLAARHQPFLGWMDALFLRAGRTEGFSRALARAREGDQAERRAVEDEGPVR